MTSRSRWLVFLISIVLFLICAPLLVFYTMGWRYNWQKSKVEKVGVLLADVKPSSSDLWLNNSLLPKKRPLRLADIKPNYYQVRASKDGYFSWQKNVEIKSQESVLLYDIVLFKNSPPQSLMNGRVRALTLSPQTDLLAYADVKSLWVKTIKNGRTVLATDQLKEGADIELNWSPDNENILIKEKVGEKTTFSVVTADGQSMWRAESLISRNLNQLFWGADSATLYGLANNNILSIDPAAGKARTIANQVTAAAFVDGDLYLVRQAGPDQLFLYKYQSLNLLNNGLTKLTSLPMGRYQFGELLNGYLTIYDSSSQTIYLADLNSLQQPLLRLNGARAVWGRGAKNNYLYYYDDSEVSLFDPKTKVATLLLRYSGGLKNILPIPNLPYFIFQVNNDLRLAELDDRDTRQIFTLYSGREVTDPQLDKKGDNIFFRESAKDGENNVYQLTIQ